MRLSEKRKQDLYDAIYDEIMRCRVEMMRQEYADNDEMLSRVIGRIWNRQKIALGINEGGE